MTKIIGTPNRPLIQIVPTWDSVKDYLHFAQLSEDGKTLLIYRADSVDKEVELSLSIEMSSINMLSRNFGVKDD